MCIVKIKKDMYSCRYHTDYAIEGKLIQKTSFEIHSSIYKRTVSQLCNFMR